MLPRYRQSQIFLGGEVGGKIRPWKCPPVLAILRWSRCPSHGQKNALRRVQKYAARRSFGAIRLPLGHAWVFLLLLCGVHDQTLQKPDGR